MMVMVGSVKHWFLYRNTQALLTAVEGATSFFLLQLSAVMSITSLLVLFPVTVLSIYTLVLLASSC